MDLPDIFPERLTSDRLLIRPAAPGDGEQFYAAIIESQEELSPWLAWTFPPPSVAYGDAEQVPRGVRIPASGGLRRCTSSP
ncbi:hypothetical protein [Zoogloea sp.]|uniref:hypothetical protein n=1 Tax=Zoogloea sp. TaxID=49181 RepID=UPI001ACBC1D9|nr:hypothetical protein [Zoogloea sp.]MBN8285720.1 hypothetical protein [Zoogloea sp.]